MQDLDKNQEEANKAVGEPANDNTVPPVRSSIEYIINQIKQSEANGSQ